MEEDHDEEEISIDFNKIKNFFRKNRNKLVEEDIKEAKQDIQEEKQELQKEKKEISEEEKEISQQEKAAHSSAEKQNLRKEEEAVKEEKQEISHEQKDIRKEEQDLRKAEKELKQGEVENAAEKVEVVQDEITDKDEEISIDLSKVKSFFKGLGRGKSGKEKVHPEKPDSEELNIDPKAVWKFIKRYQVVFLLLIPIFLSFSLRMMPDELPITDEWAENSVHNIIKQDLSRTISQQFPNLPDQQKKEKVNEELAKILEKGTIQVPTQQGGVQEYPIEKLIQDYSNSFKQHFKDENGQTYLLAIDPYFWMRHAGNVVENGHAGDIIKDGQPWDDHMLAPLGRPIPHDFFHAYFEAYTYKFVRIFNPDADLMAVCFYIPVLLSTLAVIPAFFIARRLGGNVGGLFASIMVAVHPSFLTRTVGGFADTDPYNVLFPLLIVWAFIGAFETRNLKKKTGLAVLAGFLMGVYSFTWLGWWYLFDFILATLGIYIAVQLFIHRQRVLKGVSHALSVKTIKNTLILAVVFLIASAAFVFIFSKPTSVTMPFRGPLSIITLHEVGVSKIWPNVFTTVAEQNEVNFKQIIRQLGGWMLFLISAAGIVLTMIRKDEEDKIDLKYAIFLTIWFIGTIYGSTKGVRFILLLVPAFSIAFGVALGIFNKYVSEWISKELNIHKIITGTVFFILFSFLLYVPMSAGLATARSEVPSMNDAWYNSLKKIDLQAEPDAIINSWWDFGHWFKAIADRAVTFDGTSQDEPQAHWIGKTLLTADEKEAVGILRMLDCGANTAFNVLDEEMDDTAHSVDLLYEIIVMDRDEAALILEKNGVSQETARAVLENTHCTPPEDYFITSEDMISKAGVWAHFGSWDFYKAQIFNTLKKKEYKNDREASISYIKERFNYTQEEADDIYYEIQSLADEKDVNNWIAPWPSYASGLSDCVVQGDIVACGNGIQVNLSDYQALVSTQQGVKRPSSLVYATPEGIVEKKFEEDTIEFSAALIPSGKSYKSIFMQPELSTSMFTLLFYFDGHGLKYFDMFSDERDLSGQRIIVWKVDWEGTDRNVKQELLPQEEPAPEELEEQEEDDVEQPEESPEQPEDAEHLNSTGEIDAEQPGNPEETGNNSTAEQDSNMTGDETVAGTGDTENLEE
ncbi:hypothetical protein GF351_04635 [Candidatus Woesearchaeota archaeon]|nr:hypothetical protein [Candidatus Woesearchaeota archaeon]